MSPADYCAEEVLQPGSLPGQRKEQRRWQRKYVAAEGKLSIICSLDKKRVSSPKSITVTDIGLGGIKARTNSLSWDDLHLIGNLKEAAWMPNILAIQLELPSGRPQHISFQGRAEWYLKTGAGPYYMVGISIQSISDEDREKLLTFLQD